MELVIDTHTAEQIMQLVTWLRANRPDLIQPINASVELLMRARECAEWHVCDNDDCGIHARAVMADIDAILGSAG